jgi:hypothetical protein
MDPRKILLYIHNMDIKNIFTKLYPLKEYKKLKKENPLGFYLTILIPLLLLFTFLYLYFYPFGYSKEFVFNNEDILETTRGNIYFSNLEDKQDGLTYITFDPKLPVRNPHIRLSVKGDDIHVLPIKESMSEVNDIWKYTTEEFTKETLDENTKDTELEYREFTYGYIDDYTPEDLGMYTIYMRYIPKVEIDENITYPEDQVFYPKDQQLLFKYKNMRIIQNAFSLELRVDEVYDGNLYTYQVYTFLPENFLNNEHELVAVYKKPNRENNGYIELFLNGVRSERRVVSSPYNLFFDYDDLKQYEEEIKSEVLNDLNQDVITVGQEIYRVNMDREIPKDIRSIVHIKNYYEELFKSDLPEKYIGDMYIPLTVYYDKPFYNYFEGSVNELRMGYEYPFEKRKELTELYSITPIGLPIAGERENIEEVKLEISRDPVWEKLKGL